MTGSVGFSDMICEVSKEAENGKSSFRNEMLETQRAELSRWKMMALERLAERAQWLPGKLARAALIPDGP